MIRDDDEFIERRIITGLIVSDDYIRRVEPLWNPTLLESPELRMVGEWCLDYFRKYDRAPDRDIESIYMEHLRNESIPKSDAKYIEEALASLSDEYGRGPQFNAPYLYDKTIRYFKAKDLERHSEEVQALVDAGKVDEAEQLLRSYQPAIVEDPEKGIELSDEETLDRIDRAFSEASQSVLQYPGALGKMLNPHLTRGAFVSLLAPEKRGKCLPASQKVLLSTGEEMPIGEVIEKGRRDVVSFNETTERFEVSQVSEFHRNGVKRVYQLTTRTGRRIQATSNHPFLTPDGWRDLGYLKTGDFVAVPKFNPVFGNKKMDESTIRLIAYLIADGCLRGKVGFTKSDPDIQQDFERCVEALGCRVKWYGIEAEVYNSEENAGRQGKNYVEQLMKEVGLWDKLSPNKRIPTSIFQLPKEDLALFLRVLFTCDGWVNDSTSDPQVGFAVASEPLARQVQSLLSRFGIVSKLMFTENDKQGVWTVSIGDWENMARFSEEIGFVFQKQEVLESVLSTLPVSYRSFLDKFPPQIAKQFHDEVLFELEGVRSVGSRWQKIPTFRKTFTKAPTVREQINKNAPLMRQSFVEVKDTQAGARFFNSQILWDEIVDIVYVGEKETFDITVPGNHNFVAENIIVHNSWTLIDMGLRGIRQRANVAFFVAGDMTESQVLRRICIHIAQKSDMEQYCQDRFRPVGDCVLNQLDLCDRGARNCDHGIFDNLSIEMFKQGQDQFISIKTLMQKYKEHPDYRPCDAFGCTARIGSVWVEKVDAVKPLDAPEAKERLQAFFQRYKRRFRLITYPAGVLTVTEMRRCLDDWERYDGFVPDIVIVDYADILSSDDAGVTEFRHRQDYVWKSLRALSQERHSLLITATQADAESYKKGRLNMTNFSEDKRKLAHVTAQFGLNQDPDGREKSLGIMRINEIVVREGSFSADSEVHVLQDLAAGRPFLESY